MRPFTGSRPSAAMVVALAALTLGLGGGAIAADAASGPVTKKTVKTIAKKQVNKLAPGLTVGNANSLGGKPAAAYVNSCPAAATTRSGDVCFSSVFPATTWDTALRDCANKKLRLPSVAEAMLAFQVATFGETWTDELKDGDLRELVIKEVADTGPANDLKGDPHAYFCVAAPGN